MALLGKAALAMWWEVEAPYRADFQHWHSHEHFPERLGIPGFRRATRWREVDGGLGVMVTYELDDHAVLSSQPYLDRLNAPTPWSTRMMPLHKRMVRSQCEVLETRGAYTAGHALSVRMSPRDPGAARGLRRGLRELVQALPLRPGLNGAHLLRHRPPAIAATTEQKLRGGDGVADWVLLVSGYERDALAALAQGELSSKALSALGATSMLHGLYELAVTAVPTDLGDVHGVTDPQAATAAPAG
jgi:hypothetical protein